MTAAVVAKRATDRKEIIWAVESDEDVGMRDTQKMVDEARVLSDVKRVLLKRDEWSEIAAVVDDDYRPICPASERGRVGDKMVYMMQEVSA